MKVIVGLGNPGDKYAATKHNVGFWVVDELARRWNTPVSREKFHALVGETRVAGEKVLLCKPLTFMNLSGESVREVVAFYSELTPAADVWIIYDDMDFPPGQVRLRQKGSAGGHNGMKSIIQHLGGDVFPRLRVGIGRPEAEQTVVHHVLSPFSSPVLPVVQEAVQRAADAVDFALHHGFEMAMNRYNAMN
ncbi:aminoacyl-tRNA hydrolase [Alicyclobacillus contaminans]|uniref:aminoacyl-tRNA hydrolase n=1 Tax=Alicyclobacillus contaminans TaxID=392016 RepID=UPI00047AB30B|nr:aminoacyl-tRNA hydrolase [Alicyclobacillus contaminans]